MFNNFQQQLPNNAIGVLADIDIALKQSLVNNNADILINRLSALANAGLITPIGPGTNRLTLELAIPHDDIKAQYGMQNKRVVFKIPYKIKEGEKDNKRENLIYKIALENRLSNPDFDYLLSVIPASSMLMFPANSGILIAEYITPIETIQEVRQIAKRESTPDKLASAATTLLTKDTNVATQLNKIMTILDKYFIIADLNPVYSPLNYGFKNNMLAILDLGYVLPKEGIEPRCTRCQNILHYLLPTDAALNSVPVNSSNVITKQMLTGGLYYDKNPSCSAVGFTTEPDMAVFLEHKAKLFDKYRMSGNTYILELL